MRLEKVVQLLIMIKKMKKREYILGLQDQIRKYEDFKIQYFRL